MADFPYDQSGVTNPYTDCAKCYPTDVYDKGSITDPYSDCDEDCIPLKYYDLTVERTIAVEVYSRQVDVLDYDFVGLRGLQLMYGPNIVLAYGHKILESNYSNQSSAALNQTANYLAYGNPCDYFVAFNSWATEVAGYYQSMQRPEWLLYRTSTQALNYNSFNKIRVSNYYDFSHNNPIYQHDIAYGAKHIKIYISDVTIVNHPLVWSVGNPPADFSLFGDFILPAHVEPALSGLGACEDWQYLTHPDI